MSSCMVADRRHAEEDNDGETEHAEGGDGWRSTAGSMAKQLLPPSWTDNVAIVMQVAKEASDVIIQQSIMTGQLTTQWIRRSITKNSSMFFIWSG